jgi:hypothetical protein
MIIQVLDKFQNKTSKITWADETEADAQIEPTYSGDEQAIASLKSSLSNSYGAFGHLIDPTKTTPIDLYAAMIKLSGDRFIATFSEELKITPLEKGRYS